MRVAAGVAALLGLILIGRESSHARANRVLEAATMAAQAINRETPIATAHYVVESAAVGPGHRFTYHLAWTSQAISTLDAGRFVQILEPEVIRLVCSSAMRQISDAGWSIHYQYRVPPGPEFALIVVRPKVCTGESVAPTPVPLRGRVIGSGRSFKGYTCSDDCEGHEAGYEWAQDQGISDPADCESNSASFNEGCEAAAIEAYELEQEEIHETFKDQAEQY